jgi:hypothetical protein
LARIAKGEQRRGSLGGLSRWQAWGQAFWSARPDKDDLNGVTTMHGLDLGPTKQFLFELFEAASYLVALFTMLVVVWKSFRGLLCGKRRPRRPHDLQGETKSSPLTLRVSFVNPSEANGLDRQPTNGACEIRISFVVGGNGIPSEVTVTPAEAGIGPLGGPGAPLPLGRRRRRPRSVWVHRRSAPAQKDRF